jgi:hypothetical protein
MARFRAESAIYPEMGRSVSTHCANNGGEAARSYFWDQPCWVRTQWPFGSRLICFWPTTAA